MAKVRSQFLLENINDQINTLTDEFDKSSLPWYDDKVVKQKNENKTKKYNPFEIETVNTNDKANTITKDTYLFYNKINKKCADCNVDFVKFSDNSQTCPNCGVIEDLISEEIEASNSIDGINNYNTSDNSSNIIKISGPNSYQFQRKFIGNTSNYKKTQKKNTINQMLSVIFQYNGSTPAKHVVMEAAEYYYEVQQHCIKRGEVRKGTMAACLYKKCIANQITRKPKEIADIFGIAQSELSNGCKILDELEASGLLTAPSLPIENEPDEMVELNSFLDRYFSLLNIPIDEIGDIPTGRPNYKEFSVNLIRFTQKYRIASSSIMSSKCAGTVYILSRRAELHIKRDDIERECSISKSTFSRYSQAITTVLNSNDEKMAKCKSRLTHLFKKYNIPIK